MTASVKDCTSSAVNELAALKRRMRWIEPLASCGATRPAALRPRRRGQVRHHAAFEYELASTITVTASANELT